MVTLTCTAVSYPMPDLNRWERSSDDMPLIGVEEFTTTDFDFTVVITVTVPCVSGGYFCVVGNDRGIKRTGITCGEGKHVPSTHLDHEMLQIGKVSLIRIIYCRCFGTSEV